MFFVPHFSLFFWNSNYACIKPFDIVPQLSDALFCFSSFLSTFVLCVSVCVICCPLFKCSVSFLCCQVYRRAYEIYSKSILACFFFYFLYFHLILSSLCLSVEITHLILLCNLTFPLELLTY